MIASIFIVLFGTLVYFFLDKKNTYYKLITLYMVSISLILFTIIVYVSKLSTTFRSSFGFEYMLLSSFSKVRIHVLYVSRFLNVFIALFMLVSFEMFSKILHLKRFWLALFCGLLMIFVGINDFEVTRFLHIALQTGQGFFSRIISASAFFTNALFLFSVFSPIVVLSIQCIRNKIFLNRRYNFSLLIILCIIHGFVCLILMKTYSGIWLTNIDFSKVPTEYQVGSGHFSVPILFLVLFILVSIISARLRPINSLSVVTAERWMEQNKTLSSNVGITIHTYKNAFIALRQQIELLYVYLANENLDQVKSHLDISGGIITRQLDSISKNLKNLGGGKSSAEYIDLTDCIRNAVQDCSLSCTLEMDLIPACPVIGNYESLCEVFTNVLYNADYALQNRQEPKIRIHLFEEEDYCEVDIWDNGCGIPKQNLKKIFNPFFSTKPALSFGGLGLNFVKSTVRAHHGDVRIQSQENTYTVVKIVLPLTPHPKTFEKSNKKEKKNEYN